MTRPSPSRLSGLPASRLSFRFSSARASPAGGFRPSASCSLRARIPARALGLYPQKGALLVGSDADLVVIDPEGRSTVTAAGQHTNSDYTLYEGWELSGRLELSLLRGKVVLREGELMQGPGYGRFVPRGASGTPE